MQGNILGGGGKFSVIMSAAVALTDLAALVAGSLGQLLEYSAFPEPGVRRVGATIPVGQSQCSGR